MIREFFSLLAELLSHLTEVLEEVKSLAVVEILNFLGAPGEIRVWPVGNRHGQLGGLRHQLPYRPWFTKGSNHLVVGRNATSSDPQSQHLNFTSVSMTGTLWRRWTSINASRELMFKSSS